jgi:hypothetical protein
MEINKIKALYDGNDPKTAKLKSTTKINFKIGRKSDFMTSIYFQGGKNICDLITEKNVTLAYPIGSQFNDSSDKKLKITYNLSEDYTWSSRYILDVEDALKRFVIEKVKNGEIKTQAVTLSNDGSLYIPPNSFLSSVPHLRNVGSGIGNNNQGMKRPSTIGRIVIGTDKSPTTVTGQDGKTKIVYKDATDPVIKVVKCRNNHDIKAKRPSPYGYDCKILNYSLFEKYFGSEKRSKKTIGDWKKFLNTKWTYSEINKRIKAGCLLKAITYRIGGATVVAGKVIVKLICKYLYYSDVNVNTLEDPLMIGKRISEDDENIEEEEVEKDLKEETEETEKEESENYSLPNNYKSDDIDNLLG